MREFGWGVWASIIDFFSLIFRELPRSIGRLESLRTLVIDACTNLGDFPATIKDIDSEVSSTSMILHPRSLKPFPVSLPNTLVRLPFIGNNLSNESFCMSFVCGSTLEELNLQGNQIDSFPDCVRSLKRPRKLVPCVCPRLKVV